SADPERYDVRAVLHQAGFALGTRGLDDAEQNATAGLLVIDGMRQADQALHLCRRLRSTQQEQFVPILYVAGDADRRDRTASLEHGADAYLVRPFDPTELLAQVQALLRIKDRHDQLAAKAAEAGRI